MLPSHRISPARHRAGLRIAALSILVAGFGGVALHAGASAPPVVRPDTSVSTAVEIQVDGGARIASRLLTRDGQQARASYGDDAMKKTMAAPFEIVYTVTRLDGGSLQIDTTLRQGTPLATLASPRLLTHDGQAARVEVTSADHAHTFVVTFVPKLLAAQAAVPADAWDGRQPAASQAQRAR